MSKGDTYGPVILYDKDAKAVHDALASSGHSDLAKLVASMEARTEVDRKYIENIPYLDSNEFSVDHMPLVSCGELGAYVMVWCWVPDEEACNEADKLIYPNG